ncbi:MAG: ferrous iron transport protein B [Ruminococcus sp.]|jgi:ferrous iron transport protein B
MENRIRVGFMGNPNCGKTTLFNAYTGANLKVANWPGVTVEKVEGSMKFQGYDIQLVDLPGTYSLTSYTMEEIVARQYVQSDDVDVIIDVADASALERNLYLTLQLIELGKPVVLALNMMDIVEKRGMEIDLHRLPEMLGIPVIPVSARKKKGLDILMHAVIHHKDFLEKQPLIHHHDTHTEHQHQHHKEFVMVYSDEIEDKIDLLKDRLKEKYPDLEKYRYFAIKYLEDDEEVRKQYPIDTSDILEKSYETRIINEKYDFIEEVIQETLVNKAQKAASTDKIDRWLTDRFWGLPIFLLIMALVFVLTFTVGDWLKGYMGVLLNIISESVTQLLTAIGASDWMISLIVDGIISGVGGILTFLPNIFILFLALAFLEDSGYMSRAAYVMDSLMGRLGLSGRAFIPMILGFGCTVPAVMASRALEDKHDRMKTILVTPFMSCSARLPIYVLFSQTFFEKYAGLAAFSMYVLGMVTAIAMAFIMHLADRGKAENNLLIELPEYKAPSAQTVWIYVWGKVKDYLTKAGTTIFIASILMWFVLNFGPSGYVSDISQSFGAVVGRAVIPVFKPLGLGYWQLIVALIAGISAKEVVVSSCSVLFGIGNITAPSGMATLAAMLGGDGFGPLNAYCMMTFCLLYIPCIATLATVKKETGSTRSMFVNAFFHLIVAWVVTFVIYQAGSLLGL